MQKRTKLTDSAAELLRKPNPAVITSLHSDGRPVSVATWYLLDGDQIVVSMDKGRKRLAYLRNDRRVSLTVLDLDGWETHVSIEGHVVNFSDDVGLADIDMIARHYTGSEYFNRDRARVTARIAIDHWHGWGNMKTQAAEA